MSASTESPSPSLSQSPHIERWQNTWTSFLRALRSHEEFDACYWVCQLGSGLADYLYHASGLAQLICIDQHRRNFGSFWRPIVPAIAIFLILLSLSSYFLSLRVSLVRQRWCPANMTTLHTTSGTSTSTMDTPIPIPTPCAWEHFHTIIVTYLGITILYTYLAVIFQSPGVALPLHQTTPPSPSPSSPESQTNWTARRSQGGCLIWNATLDVAAERRRVELYGPIQQVENDTDRDDSDDNSTTSTYPTTTFTFCQHCHIWRPPRCHHCSTCQRCVLQMDHHCPWVNNCIGYNNVREFTLSVTYLVLGCWYGTVMLVTPFLEVMQYQIQTHGWRIFYANGTGFLNLPGPLELCHLIANGELPLEMWIKMIFPLLTGVGFVLTGFWAFHIHYTLSAYTTLEKSILLMKMRNRALQEWRLRSSGDTAVSAVVRPPTTLVTTTSTTFTNPFDEGWKHNMIRIFGPSPVWSLLFPITLTFLPTPPPFKPPPKSKDR